MSLHALPVELLLSISEHIPSGALPALALTCSRLCPVAQRVLYRHLSASAWSRNLDVVALLARKPHIARHVRSFYIAIDSLAPVFRPFYSILAKALHNMSELQSLHLLVDSSVSWVLRHASAPHAYPSLVHFTCTFPFDDNVVCFLQKTPSLLELEVDSIPTMLARTPPIPSLPETSIPHLEQFIGSSRAATLIVPGRPVKSIHFNGTSLAEDDIPLLACSSVPVLVLAAVTNSSPVAFLQLLHRHLPHLAYLRVMSTQSLFQPPTPVFYEQVANILASFAELNAFELSGMHWRSQRKPDNESKWVWQSSPLSSTTHPDDDLLFETDIFFAY
ncbi:hypothetical protein J3R82DRAFT_4035 [Butyriboletus roseoflavus]|nr:hypothetical protein J3R82DRAFT_4035 [Butyriboletus roseoflavus]